MKICVLTTSFPRFLGDFYANFVYSFCKELRKTHDVTVVTSHGSTTKSHEIVEGVSVYRFQYFIPQRLQRLTYHGGIPASLEKSFLAKVQVPLFLFSFLLKSLPCSYKSDLIHAQWVFSGMVAVVLKWLFKIPVVLTIHGVEVYVKRGNSFTKWVIEHVDHVIFNSYYTQKRALEMCKPKSYSVVPTSINIEKFYRVEKNFSFHKRKGLSIETPLLFAVGRFIERKGFDYLIRSMPLVLKHQHAHLIIAGTGPLWDSLRELIEALKLRESITLLGFIDDEDLVAYYAECEIFVHPAIIDKFGDTEGLGMVLIEAMACETPVIGSAVGGITDIIDDGKNGLLVPEKDCATLAEKIVYLLNDRTLRRNMGKLGREKVEKVFSWQANVQKTIELYERVLSH